jgi:hypothetical protein
VKSILSIFSFQDHAFGAISRKLSTNSRTSRFPPMLLYESGFSRKAEQKGEGKHVYVYIWLMLIMEADKSHDLPSAVQRPNSLTVRVNAIDSSLKS